VNTPVRRAIYVIGSAGGAARKIIDDGFAPWWSQDGDWIYFSSTRTGVDQVWKAKFASGSVSALTQVTKNGGTELQESPDGRFIYYVRDKGVWQVSVAGGQEVRVTGPLGVQENVAVSRSGIYFMTPPDQNGNWPLQFFSFADGKVKTITRIEKYPEWGLAVSPDERWLLYPQLDAVESDLMLVENFR
jgi:hypothetical protein